MCRKCAHVVRNGLSAQRTTQKWYHMPKTHEMSKRTMPPKFQDFFFGFGLCGHTELEPHNIGQLWIHRSLRHFMRFGHIIPLLLSI